MRNRRSFLSGLASLPLVGGGVMLIGRPTAAAVQVTDDLLAAYDEWLFMERRYLCIELYGAECARQGERHVPNGTLAGDFHFPPQPSRAGPLHQPSTRAAVILSAAGVPIGGAL